MTITVLPSRNEYTANAGQTVFNYTFKIFESTDLNVYLTPYGQLESDSDLITGYSVSGVGSVDGGTITLNTPANEGDLVTIVSAIPSERTTDYQNNGDFRPDTVNEDLDRVVSITKKIEDKSSRSLFFGESLQNVTDIKLPNPEVGKALKWNNDKTALENFVPLSNAQIDPNSELGNFAEYTFKTISDVNSGLSAGGQLVTLQIGFFINTIGTETENDGKGASYKVVAGGTGVDDGSGKFIDLDSGLQLQLLTSNAENLTQFEVLDANRERFFAFLSDYDTPTGSSFGIAHTGQSLAEGGVGGDSVSGVNIPSFPGRVFMFSPKPVGLSNDVLSNLPVDLTEPSRVTISHSLTRNLANGNENTYLFSGQAWGGQAYSALKKGGSTGVYEKVIEQVSEAVDAFPGIEYIGVSVIHGEQDGINNNTSYSLNLNEWQTDFNADIKALTGQASDVVLFTCQTSTAGGYGFNGGISQTAFPTPLEQLEAHETYTNVVLVAPKYFLEYADHSHIKNISQRILGEYYAKAFKQGNSYEPLRPSTITPSGSSVIIDFVGNVGNLVFDTTLVNAVSNNGFDYQDDSANTITSVNITGTNQVTVNLSGPVGANAVVAYAYHNGGGGAANQTAGNGDRGNLRDSDTTTSLYNGDPLYNWAVTFRKAVN